MNTNELTPDLTALVVAARPLSSGLIRQVTDFAEFLGRKYSDEVLTINGKWPQDDDAVDLGGTPGTDDDVLNLSGIFDGDTGAELSRVYLDRGMHSAIGIV